MTKTSPRPTWEIRINNIRRTGDVFRTYQEASEAFLKEMNRVHFAKDVSEEERALNGQKESQAISVVLDARKMTPRQDLSVKCLRAGKPWVIQLNRLPWGTASGYNHRAI